MTGVPAIPEAAARSGDLKQAAPGHMFYLYLPLWTEGTWEKAPDRRDHLSAKTAALDRVLQLPRASQACLDALIARQWALVGELGPAHGLSVMAQTTAPFVTGMGTPHPTENGFAFLSPYGLPYLAGSGIKGALRRAAEELAEVGEAGWSLSAVWWLFGFEVPPFAGPAARLADDLDPDDPLLAAFAGRALPRHTNPATVLHTKVRTRQNAREIHVAGALEFWDAWLNPAHQRLDLDILTPHQGQYTQGQADAPTEDGAPTPVPFLVVPPGSTLTFHIARRDPDALPEPLASDWPTMMHAALRHAFDWLGFGAKTALGYGAMQEITPPPKRDAGDDWLDGKLQELMAAHRASTRETLRGKPLAEAWQAIDDPDLKDKALGAIKRRWEAEGWGDRPPGGKAVKQALRIYQGET